jgi:hypothetical protein
VEDMTGLAEALRRPKNRIRSGQNEVRVYADIGTVITGPLNIEANPFNVGGVPFTPLFNPMTTPSDLIVGGAAGAATRFPKGPDNTYLRVNPVTHELEWGVLPVDPGFANPMNTAGDLIIGGVAGAPTRQPKGGNSTLWGVDAAGNVSYQQVTAAHILDGNVTTNKLQDLGVNTGKIASETVTTGKIAAQAVHGPIGVLSHTGGAVVATGGYQTVPGSTQAILTGTTTNSVFCSANTRLSCSVNGTIMTVWVAVGGTASIEIGTFTMQAPGWHYTFSFGGAFTAAANTNYSYSLLFVANAGTISFGSGFTNLHEQKR